MKVSTFITPVLAAATALGVYALPARNTSELRHVDQFQFNSSQVQTKQRRLNLGIYGNPRAYPRPEWPECPEFNKGSFDIKHPNLYPSSAAWDGLQCVLLVGSQTRPEVIVYEPYSGHVVRIIEIPDLAPKELYQISDVHWDFYTGLWIFLVTRRGAEELRDSSMLGNTYLIKYDLTKNELIWTLNLEDTIKTSWKPKKWGGFHSIETDHQGSVYLAGTLSDPDDWGTWSECGIIIRTFFDAQFPMIWWMGMGPRGDVKIGGLANPRDSARLLTHSNKGLIGHLNLLLDMGEEPAHWLDSPYRNVRIQDVQSIMLPPKYRDFVMLLTSPTAGVQIMQNFGWKWMKDDWMYNHHSVQHTYGVLPPPANATAENGYPYETVQVGSNSIFLLFRYKNGHKNGDENLWHFEDITKVIENSLALRIGPNGFTGWNDPNIWPDADQIRSLAPLQEGWHLQLGPEGTVKDVKVELELGVQPDYP